MWNTDDVPVTFSGPHNDFFLNIPCWNGRGVTLYPIKYSISLWAFFIWFIQLFSFIHFSLIYSFIHFLDFTSIHFKMFIYCFSLLFLVFCLFHFNKINFLLFTHYVFLSLSNSFLFHIYLFIYFPSDFLFFSVFSNFSRSSHLFYYFYIPCCFSLFRSI